LKKRVLIFYSALTVSCILSATTFTIPSNVGSTIDAEETSARVDGYPEKYQHFIIYGQSLSSGSQSYPPMSLEPEEGNYMIGNQIWINYGHLSTDTTTFNLLRATEAASDTKVDGMFRTYQIRDILSMGECPLIGAVNHIQLKTKGTEYESKIIATSCGTGGCTIEALSKNAATFYKNDFIRTLAVAANIGHKSNIQINCPAIFWMQGESNSIISSGTTNSKDSYKALMIQLKNDMQADILLKYGQVKKPVFITYQMGGQYIQNFKELPISMAQLEASNEYNDVICAGPIYPMSDRGGHLDANGYRWYGEMLGKVYYETQILGQEFKPLQPIAYTGTNNPKELKIKFLVSHLPLVLDESLVAKVTNFGFEVRLNGVKATINDVTIDGSNVILTLANDITKQDVIELFYAGLNQIPIGHGNLRDSDPYRSYFKYDDLDKLDGAGKFVYPRGDAAGKDRYGKLITTLRPSPEPKDVDGKVIYNQFYPLYNFCVSFYKKIEAGQLQYDSTNGIEQNYQDLNFKTFLSGSNLVIETGDKTIEKVELYNISGSLISIVEKKNLFEMNFHCRV